jgi:DNA-binding transcriptional regulator YiaG
MLTGQKKGYSLKRDAIATGLPVEMHFRKHALKEDYFQKIADMLTGNPDKQANADMLTDMLTASYRHTDQSEWYTQQKQSDIITALVKISGYNARKLVKLLKSFAFYEIKRGKFPVSDAVWKKLCFFAFNQSGIYKNGKNDHDRAVLKNKRNTSLGKKRKDGRINVKKRWDKYQASMMTNEEYRRIKENYSQYELAERLGITLTKVQSYARRVKPARVPDSVAEKLLQIVKEDELKRNAVISVSLEHPTLF